MTTDVYPRENCIAPAIVFIVWTFLVNLALYDVFLVQCDRGPEDVTIVKGL